MLFILLTIYFLLNLRFIFHQNFRNFIYIRFFRRDPLLLFSGPFFLLYSSLFLPFWINILIFFLNKLPRNIDIHNFKMTSGFWIHNANINKVSKRCAHGISKHHSAVRTLIYGLLLAGNSGSSAADTK